MNWMKAALILVTLALLHPGFALLCVGLGTLGMALEAALYLTVYEPRLVRSQTDAPRDT